MPNPSSTITLLPAALAQWKLGKTTYYGRINPDSPTYDPDCPAAWPTGPLLNSPRALTEAEVNAYSEVIIQRGRAAIAAAPNGSGTSHQRAALMVTARRTRSNSAQAQAE